MGYCTRVEEKEVYVSEGKEYIIDVRYWNCSYCGSDYANAEDVKFNNLQVRLLGVPKGFFRPI